MEANKAETISKEKGKELKTYQVAHRLGITVQGVRYLIYKKILPAHKRSERSWRIYEEDLKEYQKRRFFPR